MENGGKHLRKATVLQVAKAVFWSFFGVRRSADHDHDAATIGPGQVIVAGLVGAVLLVAVLLVLVYFVTR